MENKDLLPVEQCCSFYKIEFSFLELLHEHGLIEIINIQEQHYLNADALNNLEKFLSMHYDLDINLEGIEVINNLLRRVKKLQQQIMYLKSKLKVYESEESI